MKTYSARGYANSNATFLLKEIAKDHEKEFLVPSFIFAICLGVEAGINDLYIDFFKHRLGPSYKDCVKPFLYLSMREKLLILLPIVSGFNFQLDLENDDVKGILRLFELRNNLTHPKQHWYVATVFNDALNESDIVLDNANITDFYSSKRGRHITVDELKEYFRLSEMFVSDFRAIAGSYRLSGGFRKGFKPRGWFKETTRKWS